jgi:Cu/Ag efflux pump CusA
MGMVLIIASAINGIITLSFNGLPLEIMMPLLAISGVGFITGIVMLNYKAKHSKRDKGNFKRTNTKSWDT